MSGEDKKMGTRHIAAVVAGALLGIASAAPGRAAPFVYVFASSGQLVKVDRPNGRIAALWTLAAMPDLGGSADGRDSGAFLESLAFDTRREELFAAIPQGAGANPEARRYRVARLRLPDLAVQASVLLPGWLETGPHLLFEERTNRLYAQWLTEAAGTSPAQVRLAVLDGETLAEVDRWNAPVPRDAPLPAWDSRFSFSGEPGRIDGPDRDLRLAGHRLTAERVALALTAEQTARAERAGPGFSTFAVDARAGRHLLTISSPAASIATQLFFVRDASGHTGSLIETPRGLGHLTPDGHRLVVQEIDGPATRPASQVRATGRVLLYDADRGTLVADLRDDRLAGTVGTTGFICADPTGALLVWRGQEGRLALLDPAARTVAVPNIDLTLDAEALCVFATE